MFFTFRYPVGGQFRCVPFRGVLDLGTRFSAPCGDHAWPLDAGLLDSAPLAESVAQRARAVHATDVLPSQLDHLVVRYAKLLGSALDSRAESVEIRAPPVKLAMSASCRRRSVRSAASDSASDLIAVTRSAWNCRP